MHEFIGLLIFIQKSLGIAALQIGNSNGFRLFPVYEQHISNVHY